MEKLWEISRVNVEQVVSNWKSLETKEKTAKLLLLAWRNDSIVSVFRRLLWRSVRKLTIYSKRNSEGGFKKCFSFFSLEKRWMKLIINSQTNLQNSKFSGKSWTFLASTLYTWKIFAMDCLFRIAGKILSKRLFGIHEGLMSIEILEGSWKL